MTIPGRHEPSPLAPWRRARPSVAVAATEDTEITRKIRTTFNVAAVLVASAIPSFAQDGPRVGMNLANLQEEHWKINEAGIKAGLADAGGTLISTDAQSSLQKQASDVESLLASTSTS